MENTISETDSQMNEKQIKENQKLPLLKSDGSVNIVRLGLKASLGQDLYHFLIKARWPVFLFLICMSFITINFIFASIYLWCGDCIEHARSGSLFDAFFFSVETMSTIGYGSLSPQGFLGHVIMTAEAIFGILFTAVTTGLVFTKFSNISARVLFSDVIVIGPHNSKKHLMLRMANERSTQIIEASAHLRVSKDEVTDEGELYRHIYDLDLVRTSTPLFSISWTLFHLIDENSPLYGETKESLLKANATFILTLIGTDDTLLKNVHARKLYDCSQLKMNALLSPVLTIEPSGQRIFDYTKFHDYRVLD